MTSNESLAEMLSVPSGVTVNVDRVGGAEQMADKISAGKVMCLVHIYAIDRSGGELIKQ